MKALKNMGFGPRKSKSGFTLIELLIVMVILAILAGVVVMAVGGVFGTAKGSAYTSVKDDLQNSVTGYATDHQGNFPYNTSAASMVNHFQCNGSAGDENDCYIVNFNLILTSQGGMMREVPDGSMNVSAGTAAVPNDNCDGGATGCSQTSHYVWGADIHGNVYSKCVDIDTGDCDSTTLSGYQNVWP